MSLPKAASEATPLNTKSAAPNAYIINPISGKERLTPAEAMDAISRLSSILVCDDKYRKELETREAPK